MTDPKDLTPEQRIKELEQPLQFMSQKAQAFQQVLRTRCHPHPLMHHSDRGIQYCSALYQSLHERYGGGLNDQVQPLG